VVNRLAANSDGYSFAGLALSGRVRIAGAALLPDPGPAACHITCTGATFKLSHLFIFQTGNGLFVSNGQWFVCLILAFCQMFLFSYFLLLKEFVVI
jgi:hypothetical protein